MRSLISLSLLAAALLGCDSSSSSSSSSADASNAGDTSNAAGDTSNTTEDTGGGGTEPDLANGEKVAGQVCAACHGPTLTGGTSFGECTSADLHELPAEGWSAETIVASLRNGVDDEGAALCATMPRYTTGQLSDKDATDVAAYLLTLK